MKVRVLGVALLVTGVSLGAQAPQPPVFRSGLDLVRFDVRVTDAAGRPVTDLRPDELEIVEDGRPRPILLFQHVAEPAGSYADAALRAVSAEVTSNKGTPRGHLYILVFDQQHITPGNEQSARRAADAFIAKQVRPSDRVAIVGLPGPGPQLGFTADKSRAVAELQKVRGGLERNAQTAMGSLSLQEAYQIASGNDRTTVDVMTRYTSGDATADIGIVASPTRTGGIRASAAEDPAITRRLIVENARTLVAQADSEARQFLQRLTDLIEQYRAIEGRKTVILFSEGFHQQNLTRELEEVEAAAAESYAVFYSFDLNRRGSDISQKQMSSTDLAAEIQARLEPLGSLAAETDGILVPDATSHLTSALNEIAAQAQDYYLVGFPPSEAALAARGSYRRVSVRVKRAGAHVSARTGYATPKNNAPLDRRRAIDAALAAPFVQQAIKVDYTTYVTRADVGTHARVILSLDADLPVRDAQRDSADVVFVVRDTRDGHVAASGTDTMPLPQAPSPGSATGTGSYRVQFDLPPGTYLMRTVVREPGGLIGSADRKLDVRSLAGPDVAVSDLILGSTEGSLPVRARAYTDDGLPGLVETYGRSPDQLASLQVLASLVPAGGDTPVTTVKGDVGEVTSAGTAVMRRATFAIPLTQVPPGAYVARVRVTAGGEAVADLTRELEIRAGTTPVTASNPAIVQVKPRDILAGDLVRGTVASLREETGGIGRRATRGFDLFADEQYVPATSELADVLKDLEAQVAVDRNAGSKDTASVIAFVLGWAYEAAANHRQAIGSWRAATALNPRLVPAYLALSDGYLRLGEPALAVQALRAGLAVLPESIELQAKLAAIEKR